MRKRLPVIYVSSAMTAADGWLWEQNCRRAEEIGFEIAALGAAPIVPATMGRFFNGAYDRDTWMEIDISILAKCDVLVTVPGWENSLGAQEEVAFCQEHGIPVYSLPPLPWNKPIRAQIERFLGDLL